MLRYSQTTVRSISFFVPTSRMSEFNRRTLQSNPTVEVLQENYNDLEHYYKMVFPSVQKPSPGAMERLPKGKLKIRSANELGMPLSSFILEACELDSFPKVDSTPLEINTNETSKIKEFQERLHYFLNVPDTGKLYYTVVNNTQKINLLCENLTPSELSVLIRKLISHSLTIHKKLRFTIMNKHVLGDDITATLKKLNATDRAVFKSTRAVFNSLKNKMDLTLNDYDEIIKYYFQRNNIQEAIDLISNIEGQSRESINSKLHLTNTMWKIKLEVLSKTDTSSWNLFGEPIVKKKAGLTLRPKYQYPHHSNNFQILFKYYENDKIKYGYPDDLSIVNIIIRGLGKNSDIPSLDKLLESYWGIKVDRDSSKGVHHLAHFNIKKNVTSLLWPDESTLISILLAYTKNGYFASAVEINNLIIQKYNDTILLNPKRLTKYWESALKCAALFGGAVEKGALEEVGGSPALQELQEEVSPKLNLKYRLFDQVWEIAETYLGSNITRGMINLKVKNASSHELLKGLPGAFRKVDDVNYNRTNLNFSANKNTLKNYVQQCCKELAYRGSFLDANNIIEKFITSKATREELKTELANMQEIYARERVKKEEQKRRMVDDDDEFELW